MKLLIDGDILVYQAISPKSIWKIGGRIFNIKKQAVNYHIQTHGTDRITHRQMHPVFNNISAQLRSMIKDISTYLGSNDVVIFLKGDGGNYRAGYAKTVLYKGQRPSERPYGFQYARTYLADKYEVVYANGQESDDLMGIASYSHGGIICSKDKDMLTIPGLLYNPYKNKLKNVTHYEADLAFHTQLLTGDRADNVSGILGIGPVKAAHILSTSSDKKDMLYRVLKTYEQKRGISSLAARDAVDEIGKLLYIRRRPLEIWSVEGELYGK